MLAVGLGLSGYSMTGVCGGFYVKILVTSMLVFLVIWSSMLSSSFFF